MSMFESFSDTLVLFRAKYAKQMSGIASPREETGSCLRSAAL